MPRRAQREPRIALEGRVDAAAIQRCRARVAQALREGPPGIVVDLRSVTALPLPELSLLCRLLRQAGAARIAVVGGPPHARRTIALCAIDGVELRPAISADSAGDAVPAARDVAAWLWVPVTAFGNGRTAATSEQLGRIDVAQVNAL